jgi:hypothetical protein
MKINSYFVWDANGSGFGTFLHCQSYFLFLKIQVFSTVQPRPKRLIYLV